MIDPSKIDTPKEPMDEFFQQLSDLCLRYGVEIGGCGCCGSPYIDADKHTFHGEDLRIRNNGEIKIEDRNLGEIILVKGIECTP